ncbi:ribosomal protein S18-alanine N-acetyltransferase [Psychrobacter sp. PP-21]|uniref:ribosomal protein S18-alanine N-acetyltransferase n=1 Tax=Psychrobacter sp. PP-21 TaxID=2957503 RepID=UPI0029A28BC6|nr:ribosomal protein S18-alanine N-acetyltransferase [Psychrobacter sp. PP-21]MDX2374409.1 ribosomal protein S18-alanine N-acetyltransferase [Psychrobacter sp. PP-21]
MFAIEASPINVAESEKIIQAVANIEAIVQPQDAWSYQTLLELLNQDSINMLIVYAPDKSAKSNVIGYCLYQMLFEQAEILRIGTHPDYQRQGVATQTIDKLHDVLQSNQVESLLLEVRADNHAAIALYEWQEFVVIHKRKGYYQSPHQPAVDALIMQHTYTE